MATTSRMTYGELGSVDSSLFTGSYIPIGSPLLYSSGIIKLVNSSNIIVTVSIDGVTDCDILPANSFFLYDISANLPSGLQGSFFPQGTQFYVSGAAGTGLVYIVYLYLQPTTPQQIAVL